MQEAVALLLAKPRLTHIMVRLMVGEMELSQTLGLVHAVNK